MADDMIPAACHHDQRQIQALDVAELSQHQEVEVRMPVRAADRGSATLWGVALMGLLMAAAVALVAAGSVRVARHKANDAADLSALGAARVAVADPEGACVRAASLASDNGVDLVKCQVHDEVVDVWTALTVEVIIVGPRTVTGRARAGPGQPAPAGGAR
jgi:secretion/DNA translocation related TadE-like protein